MSSGGGGKSQINWVTAVEIAGPIVCLSVIVMIIYHIRRSKRKKRDRHYPDDSHDAPDRPILDGVTIRDMLEMTTSGSGSGRSN